MKRFFAKHLLKFLEPLVKFLAKIHTPYAVKKITGKHYYNIRDFIKPFDVILSSVDGHASNLINPSDINHGYFYLGDVKMDISGKEYTVKGGGEYTAIGGNLDDLVSQLVTKDRVIIARFQKFTKELQKHELKHYALELLGGKYDYEFFEGNNDKKFFYCFEYIIAAIGKVFPDAKFLKYQKLGQSFYSSDTFTEDSINFKIIYDSKDHHDYVAKLNREERV